MENTIFVGDLHLLAGLVLPELKKIIKKYDIKHVVFMGDYLDQFQQGYNDQHAIHEMNLLKHVKEEWPVKTTFLIGNHDYHYFTLLRPIYSNYGTDTLNHIKHVLDTLQLQVATKDELYVASHAGFNKAFTYSDTMEKPLTYEDNDLLDGFYEVTSHYRGGKYNLGSPIWADFREMIYDINPDLPLQVVGHTPQKTVEFDEGVVCVDTFSLDSNLKPYGDGSFFAFIDNKMTTIPFKKWKHLNHRYYLMKDKK